MTSSYTYSETQTFTITHARHIAVKVATDLKRLQRFYDKPTDNEINDYEKEIIILLKHGYLETVTYGFQKNGKWIEPTIKYSEKDLFGAYANDDDPGRIRPNANISGASFHSFLTYNSNWDSLTQTEKDAIKNLMPFKRGYGDEPDISGYMNSDRIYSAGGHALYRETVRSYS